MSQKDDLSEFNEIRLNVHEKFKQIIGGSKEFPKYTTQIMNIANQNAQGTRPEVVGQMSELINKCPEKNYKAWKEWYLQNYPDANKRATQKVKTMVDNMKEEECIDYMYNLVLNRTFEGYDSEIQIINDELKKILGIEIKPAPDEWDRRYNVDYYIEIGGKYIGLQIKPIESGVSLNDYQWYEMHEKAHKEFKEKFGGAVFFVFSVKSDKKKVVHNKEVIDEIKAEIERSGEYII